MALRLPALTGLFLLLGARGVLSQTVFTEVEPNGTKAEATPAVCLTAGDSVSGTTTGTSVTVGNTALTSADTFRVKTCALPLGVYRHSLTLTVNSGTLPTATIRGLNQSSGVVGTTDTTMQTSLNAQVVWYGFGKQEEIYYRVTGAIASTGTYTATLTTTPITVGNVAGTFLPGNVTIDASGQGHTTDTEVWLYDSTLAALPCGGNDDKIALQSQITLPLAAGTYFLGISTFNMGNNLPSPTPPCPSPDNYLSGAVLDFPDAIADSISTMGTNLQFQVTDNVTTTVQPATKSMAFAIEWFRVQVGAASTPTTPFCFGNGTGAACPCGNNGAAGNGCASSVNSSGAHLAGSGVASLSADTFVLTGTGMPNSSVLYFQGTIQVGAGAGVAFGDGLRCVGGQVIRLATKVNVGGTSSYPQTGDTGIAVKGLNVAGGVRYYQAWYRNAAAFCSPATFNLSNGLGLTWGA